MNDEDMEAGRLDGLYEQYRESQYIEERERLAEKYNECEYEEEPITPSPFVLRLIAQIEASNFNKKGESKDGR